VPVNTVASSHESVRSNPRLAVFDSRRRLRHSCYLQFAGHLVFFGVKSQPLRCGRQIHISQIVERQKAKFSEDFAFLGRSLGGIPYCFPACGVVCSRRKVPNIRRSVLHPSSGQLNSTRLHNARTQNRVSVKSSALKMATLRAGVVHGVELECSNCDYCNTYSIERTKRIRSTMQYNQTDIYINFITAFIVNILIHCLFDNVCKYRLFQVIFT